MKIAKESWVIAVIGIADLITTIIFIRHHGAQEANPLFRMYWEMGLSAFVAAKFACLFGPIMVLEWARRRNPRFVSRALRGAIAAYLILYGIGFAKLNSPQALAEEPAAMASMIENRPPFALDNPDMRAFMRLEYAFASSRTHLPYNLLWSGPMMPPMGIMLPGVSPFIGMYPPMGAHPGLHQRMRHRNRAQKSPATTPPTMYAGRDIP